jgi:predicted DsbA family dithiol-disulfide isomerase
MIRTVGTGALALAISWGTAASARAEAQAEAPPAAKAASGADVAATVAGTPIGLAEVDDLIRPQLMELRAREQQLRSQALDVLIGRALIEKEASARGMTPEALDQLEVKAKVHVADAEVATIYASNKSRFSNTTEAAALEQIRSALGAQRENERRTAYARELRGRYDVHVTLEPFRVPVELAAAPTRGNPNARVTLLEFSDFQCPYCQRVRPTMNKLRELYSDRVRFAFRHYPLDFHPLAEKAGEAAACAGAQGKFWQMHDRLWANPDKLGVDELKAHAQSLGLDTAAFDSCLDSGRYASRIEGDLKAGQEYGVSGTPAFFVNGRPLVGAQSLEAFEQVIDDELARTARAGTTAP